MKIEKVVRKSMLIRPSGRSTDFIAPSFIYECGFNCGYCYVKRHGQDKITIAKNVTEILNEINRHAVFAFTEKPNQTHSKFITYDLGCNSDIALHAKNIEWQKIFQFFKEHPTAMGSFATKYVNPNLINFDPKGKIRIRFSLMPQNLSDILEPKTSNILDRIKAINAFIDAGYDVHVNFSPVIVYNNWLNDYEYLFELLNDYVDYKNEVKAEVIFLTHNINRHKQNSENVEKLLWSPNIQEFKTSQYGGENIRYKANLKSEFINQFINLHDKVIPWNTLRYIF